MRRSNKASFSADEKSEKSKVEIKASKSSKLGSHYLLPLAALDKVTKRVVAPYAQIKRKSLKEENVQEETYLELDRFKFFLDDEVDLNTLLYETAVAMKNITASSGVFVYIVNKKKDEIVLMPQNIQNAERHEVNIPICTGKTAASHAAATKEFVRLDDVERDTRFSEGLRWVDARMALCVPVVAPDGECYAVVELYRCYSEAYNDVTLQWALTVCGWAGAAVHQTGSRVLMQRRKHLDVELQRLLQMYFSDRVGLDTVITDMLVLIKMYIGALRSSFYIIDKDHIGDLTMADMWDDGLPVDSPTMVRKKLKVNLSLEESPAALVAHTGESLNLADVYADCRFTAEIDPATGAVVRTLLAYPLTDKYGVIGVVQVINKTAPGTLFTAEDEEMFAVFVSYSCLVVHFANMQQSMTYNGKLNEVCCDLLALHLNPCRHDLDELLNTHQVVMPPANFKSFDFHIGDSGPDEMPRLLSYMLAETLGESNYDSRNMANFILTVVGCYRQIPYHNAEHAFHFTHTMYVVLNSNKDYFGFSERAALMVGGLCHDIDHPGYNNNFLALCNHPLAAMYHSSTLENHHFFLAKKIIEDKNLLSRLPDIDRTHVMTEMRYNILCTDLAVYFRTRAQLSPILSEQLFNFSDQHHRSLLKGIMMTTCDLSACCKPFAIAKSITETVYEEFYHQGDRERQMGYAPLSMMDRRRSADQPAEQVQFISVVVLPCLLMLQGILPNTRQLADNCRKTQDAWREELEIRGERLWRQDEAVPRAMSQPTITPDKSQQRM